MVVAVNTPQAVTQVSQYGRLMAAGARGVATVDRNSQVEESSQHFGYNPDDDGLLFNASFNGKHKSPPGPGDS